MEVKLREPRGDKNWGVEFFNATKDDRGDVIATMQTVKYAHPFLQCDGDDYIFVEFWTSEMAMIENAFKAFSALKN